MSTRAGRRKTGGSGPGLWNWTPDGDQRPQEVRDNPLLRRCPWCRAPIGESCRKRVHGRWVPCPPHDARKTAGQVDQNTPATPPQRHAQPRTDTR